MSALAWIFYALLLIAFAGLLREAWKAATRRPEDELSPEARRVRSDKLAAIARKRQREGGR